MVKAWNKLDNIYVVFIGYIWYCFYSKIIYLNLSDFIYVLLKLFALKFIVTISVFEWG